MSTFHGTLNGNATTGRVTASGTGAARNSNTALKHLPDKSTDGDEMRHNFRDPTSTNMLAFRQAVKPNVEEILKGNATAPLPQAPSGVITADANMANTAPQLGADGQISTHSSLPRNSIPMSRRMSQGEDDDYNDSRTMGTDYTAMPSLRVVPTTNSYEESFKRKIDAENRYRQKVPQEPRVRPADITEVEARKRYGIPYSSCDREIVHFQVGCAGNRISNHFWQRLCDEHMIQYDGYDRTDLHATHGHFVSNFQKDMKLLQNVSTFFTESTKGRYVPRAILLDTDNKELINLMQTNIGRMYNVSNVFTDTKPSGNNCFKAYEESEGIVKASMDALCSELEKADKFQGITVCHALAGGCGAGTTSYLLEQLHDILGPKEEIHTMTLGISRREGDKVMQSYNAVAGMSYLNQYASQVMYFDPVALTELVMNAQDIGSPEFAHKDQLLASILSGITSSLRFPGTLDADLRKMRANLQPLPDLKWLTAGVAPVMPLDSVDYRKVRIIDMMSSMLDRRNCSASVNPVGIDKNNRAHIFLGIFTSWRGARGVVTPYEIDAAIHRLHEKRPRHFPNWLPTSISSSICHTTHETRNAATATYSPDPSYLEGEMTYLSNSTSIVDVFDDVLDECSILLSRNSFTRGTNSKATGTFDADILNTMIEELTATRNRYDALRDNFDPFTNPMQAETGGNSAQNCGVQQYNELTAMQTDMLERSKFIRTGNQDRVAGKFRVPSYRMDRVGISEFPVF